jgi:uncharacterized protein
MKKILIIVPAVIVCLYLLICLAIYAFQKHIVFVPSRCSDPPPEDLGIKEISFPTGNNQTLYGWWMPVDSSDYTILFFHGNGGCVPLCVERMRFFRELGYSTLAIDYRGYGKSTGSLNCEEDIYEDGRNTLKYVADSLKIPTEKLIVWGWSLGGAVTVDVCRYLNLKAIVLEGTMFSTDDIARINYPIFPTKWISNFHFRSGEKIKDIKAPMFFIHSKDDNTIPIEQGRKLFDATGGIKEFLETSGSHNHGIYENKVKIIDSLRAFLVKIH